MEEPGGEDRVSSEDEDPAAVSKPKQSSLSDDVEKSDATGRDGDVPGMFAPQPFFYQGRFWMLQPLPESHCSRPFGDALGWSVQKEGVM